MLAQELNDKIEQTRRRGDDLLEKLIIPMLIVSVVLGLIYDTLLSGILLSLGCAAIFLLVKHAVPRNFFTRLILVNAWGIMLAVFIYQSHGQPDIRNMYYVITALLIVYQDQRLCYYAVVTALVYLNGGYYLQTQGIIKPESYYGGQLTLDFLLVQNFVIMANAVASAWIARTLLQTTVNAIEKQLEHEKQMVFREKNIDFAHKISSGNLDAELEASSEDPVSEALVTMRTNLQTAARKEKQDKFVNTGLAQIGDLLRSGSDINTLAGELVPTLVKYVKANQGALFVLQDEDNQPYLEMAACYAYERRKYLQKRIEVGEGLVGQAVQEGDKLYLTDIPADYVNITSGLGKATPRCILIVPLKFNGRTEGVIELASFRPFEAFEVDFVEKLAESIASTLSTTRTTDRTRLLLEEVTQQAEEMRAQEEEMRQNMEELMATQEHQRRLQEEVQEKMRELEETKAEMEQVRLAEKARTEEQIEKRNQIMKQTVEKFKQKEQELIERIRQQEEELAALKNA